MRLLLTLILLSITTSALSAEQTYVREYTYKASDLDSKVTSRSNALKLIKAGVLEEIITFVNTDSAVGQKLLGDEFSSSFIHHAKSQSAGFLKTKLLEETWNGEELWLKAKVTADPEKVREELLKSLSIVKQQKSPDNSPPPVQAHVTKPIPVSVTKPPPAPTPIEVHVHIDAPTPASVPVPAQAPIQKSTPAPSPLVMSNVTQDYSGYLMAAKFAQALALISPIRMMTEQERSMSGEWPTKLEQIGISKEDTNDGQYINEVRLGNDGEIITLLSQEFGNKRVIKLAPKSIMGGTSLRWQCFTNISIQDNYALRNLNCENDPQLRYQISTK